MSIVSITGKLTKQSEENAGMSRKVKVSLMIMHKKEEMKNMVLRKILEVEGGIKKIVQDVLME